MTQKNVSSSANNNEKESLKPINPILRYFYAIISMFRTNIRDYGMFIALIVIFILFTISSNGIFLTPRNFSNLLDQTAYVAVLAIGMTLVIVTRQIDLSVGFLSAFLGAYVIVAVQVYGENLFLAISVALLITTFVGIIKGYLIANVKVPSFVVTLAGMFIFKGFLMIRTDNTTITTTHPFFQAIGKGYLFRGFTIGGYNIVALGIGVLLIFLLVFTSIMRRRKNQQLGVQNEERQIYLTKQILTIFVLAVLAYNLAAYNGISYLFLITLVVLVIYFIFTTKSTLGRRIYAVGGNPEAAELSGIKVSNTLIIVFISMGILSLIAGLMYATKVQNTSPQHGVSWELYAIAATFIGGASAGGGVGKVVNSVIGAIVIMSIPNGLALTPDSNANIEPIILGSILLLAVIFDIYTRNVRPVDLVGMYYAKKVHGEELKKAKADLSAAKAALHKAKANGEKLIDYEYALTNAQTSISKIKNMIRIAQEEEFMDHKIDNDPYIPDEL
ncbi:MAG: sugar ABC transporter permease [Tenericutes bacterium]|jgi:putative multiple sugar transport system permease protein|nr:sugar ABC transporter permease [Mycoplasmatota bacterium]